MSVSLLLRLLTTSILLKLCEINDDYLNCLKVCFDNKFKLPKYYFFNQ